MRKGLLGLTVLFVLFCMYWAAARTVMINSLTAEIQELETQNYTVNHNGFSVGGFPLKFRGSLKEPDLTSPRGADRPWSIKSTLLEFQASVFNPRRWTIYHRGDARLDLRGPKGERWLFDIRPFTVDIDAVSSLFGDLRTFKATLSRPQAQAVIGTLPPIIAMDEAKMSAAPAGQDMRLALHLKNIFLERETLKQLQIAFGPKLDRLEIDAIAIGLQSLDQDSVKAWQENGQLICENWLVSWGGAEFQGSCDLTQTAQGLTGTIRAETKDISRLFDRLQSSNVITANQAGPMKFAAILLPVNAEGRQEVTLNIRGGFLTLFGQKIWAF